MTSENKDQQPVSDKVLDRVKKMLFKAQDGSGATEAEAQECLLKAQAMMAKHNLTLEDVGGIEAVHKEKQAVEIKVMHPTKLQWWEKDLANTISTNFRCFTFWNTFNGRSTLKFLGLEEDALLARDMFTFARKAVEHLSILYLDREEIEGLGARTRARNSWIKGFIQGLEYKFNEQVAANGWLQVIEPDKAVVEAHDAKKIRTEAASTQFRVGDLYDQQQGFKEGKELERNSNRLTSKASN